MEHNFWKNYSNQEIEKIYITKNLFKVINNNPIRIRFESMDELMSILNDFFTNSSFNRLFVYKIIERGGKKNNYIKADEFYDGKSEYDVMVICDKEYLSLLKKILKNMGYDNSNEKKKQKVLN